MKNLKLYAIAALAAIACTVSCNEKEIETNIPSVKQPMSLVASGEAQGKVFLDFSESANVRWSDDDLIAVFDGTAMNQFSIDPGTNTGAAATFSGEVTAGATSLYAVYPYSAAGSLSSSNITVTVPSAQVVGSSANVDPAALVSVGVVDNGAIEFKQVCGLLKIEVTGSEVHSIVVSGNALAGTATVAGSTGVISSVSSASNSITLTYEGDANFPAGTYYVAVLPGTTPAGNFSIQLVNAYGATSVKTASSAVTFQRLKGMDAGNIDGSASFARHITNKDELFAWGAAMGKESGVTVYIDNDIDCESDPWPYSGAFDGTLEGQNHKIYNFIAEQSTGACLIGTLNGSVKNIIIGSSDGTTWDGVSVFRHSETGLEGPVYLAPVNLLGDGASMTDVINFAKVEATSASDSRVFVGGLVGHLGTDWSATMTNCKNYGNIVNASVGTQETRMGGIMAQCNGSLTASGLENHGNLTSTCGYNSFVGGLCGDLGSGSVISGTNVNKGNISVSGNGAKKYVGGCFGSMRGSSISSCTNSGTVNVDSCTSTDNYIGGITGLLQSKENSITDCHNTNSVSCGSSVTGRSYLGGITGGCNGASSDGITIDSCTNSGSVINNGGASDIGGIAGQIAPTANSITVTISNCTNSGAVSSTVEEGQGGNVSNLNIGGIAGQLDPTNNTSAHNTHIVSGCNNTSTGHVSTAGAFNSARWLALGGIVGTSKGDLRISSCSNEGLVDYDGDTSYSSMTNAGAMYTGGIIGYISGGANTFGNASISICTNKGIITSGRAKLNYLGGIVGNAAVTNNYTVTSCKNFGTISKTAASGSENSGTRVGGLIGGANKATCTKCYNFGSVSTVSNAGKAGAIMGGSNTASLWGSNESEANYVCDDVVVTWGGGVITKPSLGTYTQATLGQSQSGDDKNWFCPGNDSNTLYIKLVAHSSGE